MKMMIKLFIVKHILKHTLQKKRRIANLHYFRANFFNFFVFIVFDVLDPGQQNAGIARNRTPGFDEYFKLTALQALRDTGAI